MTGRPATPAEPYGAMVDLEAQNREARGFFEAS
jgi:hypothetical protein